MKKTPLLLSSIATLTLMAGIATHSINAKDDTIKLNNESTKVFSEESNVQESNQKLTLTPEEDEHYQAIKEDLVKAIEAEEKYTVQENDAAEILVYGINDYYQTLDKSNSKHISKELFLEKNELETLKKENEVYLHQAFFFDEAEQETDRKIPTAKPATNASVATNRPAQASTPVKTTPSKNISPVPGVLEEIKPVEEATTTKEKASSTVESTKEIQNTTSTVETTKEAQETTSTVETTKEVQNTTSTVETTKEAQDTSSTVETTVETTTTTQESKAEKPSKEEKETTTTTVEEKAPTVAYQEGDDSPYPEAPGKIKNIEVNTKDSYENLAKDPEKDQKANDKGTRNRIHVRQKENGQLAIYAMPASNEAMNDFNQGKIFNHQKLHQLFLDKINKTRQDRGLQPLQYASGLQAGADVRANEMAKAGNIRYVDKYGVEHKHTRQDGTHWSSAFPEGSDLASECVASNYALGYPYRYVSEEYVANAFYEQWLASPAHKDALLRESAQSLALSVRAGVSQDEDINGSDTRGYDSFYGAAITSNSTKHVPDALNPEKEETTTEP